MSKIDINSMTFDELAGSLEKLNLPKYRVSQIYTWLHQKKVTVFDEMSNISKDLIRILDANYEIRSCVIEKKRVSKLDGTIKYLFRLNDGEYIESVLMKYKYGYSICVSSQVGCRMGCKFCASTIGGVVRNLTASEILAQLYFAERDEQIRISHIVLMGIGEPLDNYDSVIRFITLVKDEKGANVSARNISLSTCGIVPRIYDLLNEKIPLTLSVSLHAPNDDLRNSLMPINHKYSVHQLIRACRDYAKVTSRRISFEYAMISGVNDTVACADQLADLLKGVLCHVNLIPVNAVRENQFIRSDIDKIRSFQFQLQKRGLNVTIRRSLGGDIEASCGQLRNKHLSV
ncbi:putative dual-specificity RNA methyltransferase RlmN [bioreactor metagenome]|uniref:Putative dual-specificity RNA methyltransferase RlmN n=1 Tax=bioreactor metagenome TaxID=1076179 RepID=A0A645C7B2_9ZZZZ